MIDDVDCCLCLPRHDNTLGLLEVSVYKFFKLSKIEIPGKNIIIISISPFHHYSLPFIIAESQRNQCNHLFYNWWSINLVSQRVALHYIVSTFDGLNREAITFGSCF